jgi:hypothetical protein
MLIKATPKIVRTLQIGTGCLFLNVSDDEIRKVVDNATYEIPKNLATFEVSRVIHCGVTAIMVKRLSGGDTKYILPSK